MVDKFILIKVLEEIDAIARDFDKDEYGLPLLFSGSVVDKMIEVLENFINEYDRDWRE